MKPRRYYGLVNGAQTNEGTFSSASDAHAELLRMARLKHGPLQPEQFTVSTFRQFKPPGWRDIKEKTSDGN